MQPSTPYALQGCSEISVETYAYIRVYWHTHRDQMEGNWSFATNMFVAFASTNIQACI